MALILAGRKRNDTEWQYSRGHDKHQRQRDHRLDQAEALFGHALSHLSVHTALAFGDDHNRISGVEVTVVAKTPVEPRRYSACRG